ncbi:MAG TPA: substrate-binding domain-containing protein [Bacteroidales bacterium]|nr:substrate-binding domain-containing protein [Bacteroidales bacterium]HRZ47889.1 substrate-binding domain-containing protein [Bacteroidales bacterium]
MKSNIGFLLAVVVMLTACSSGKQKEQTITISGAFALYPLVVQWAEEYNKEHPEIRFNISGGGAGKGLADALSGAVDLGMFSRELTEEELAKGTWYAGLTIDAVVPVMNAKNPATPLLLRRGMKAEEFAAAFVQGSLKDWGDLPGITTRGAMAVYTRSDACGAAETWAKYLGARQEDLKGIGIFGDPGLADAVVKDPSAIGFNNTAFAYDIKTGTRREGLEIIPIDINSNGVVDPDEQFYGHFEQLLKAIADGKYPSPPARELYFVANGKPQKQAVIDFIRWTLTEGRKMIPAAGYVPISQDKVQEYLNKL